MTRWTLAATIPLLLLFAIAPEQVLHVFGSSYDAGAAWLRILLIGQIVNVSVGAAGFVLIMAGRTGWDLTVYAASFVLDLAIALALVPALGPKGAAIAQTLTLVFSNVFRVLLVRRFVRILAVRPELRLVVPTVIGAVAMVLVHGWLAAPLGIDLLGTGCRRVVYYAAFLLFG
ncbi:MAG: polysaccharide biosynthesis C-terminal domain-containing protein [Actinomycetota bacterium]